MKLLVATRSDHKLREIVDLLERPALELVTLSHLGVSETSEENLIETFDSFEANALAKASYFHRLTGLPTLADDSGLCVDALQGAPGVRSKRFASDAGRTPVPDDAANNALLLEMLDAELHEPRTAQYVCVAAVVGVGAEPIVCRGVCEGLVAERSTGSNGFGYDPLFIPLGESHTFGVLPDSVKRRLSHRARAMHALAEALDGLG